MESQNVKYLIDSNIFIYMAAGNKKAWEVAEKTAKAKWAGYSAISRLEVLGYPELSSDDEIRFQGIMNEYNEVAVSYEIINKAINIRKGKKIKTPDSIIAATALYWNATLITRNASDFSGINGLDIYNPFV